MISNFISGHDFTNINYLVINALKRGTNNVVASLHSESVDFRNSSGSFATFRLSPILSQQLGRRSPLGLFLIIKIAELLPAAVLHDVGSADVLD
jgi:hypothetical protein